MDISFHTTAETIEMKSDGIEEATNDEICRTIAYLEMVKQDLMKVLTHDYEVFTGDFEEDDEDEL